MTKAHTSDCDLANINPFRYRGYVYDSETGLYYLKSRYYDPVTGRFLNIKNLQSKNIITDDKNMVEIVNNILCKFE